MANFSSTHPARWVDDPAAAGPAVFLAPGLGRSVIGVSLAAW